MLISFYDYCKESGREYLLKEWHKTNNGENTPHNTAKTSRNIIFWKCEKGHEWQTQAVSRINGTGCPECYRIKQEEKRKERIQNQKFKEDRK